MAQIDDGFCIVDVLFDEAGHPIDYYFVEVNAAFESHTGMANAGSRRVRELVPGIEQWWVDTYAKVAQSGESIRFENHSPSLSRWFEVHAFALGERDAKGLFQVGILFKEITARKTAEGELRDARDRLEAGLQAGNVATWIWLIENDEILADRNLADMFGVVGGDGTALPISVYFGAIHHEDRDAVQQKVNQAIESGDVRYEAHYRIELTGRPLRHVVARGRVERDANGKALRLAGVVLDDTERQQSIEALRESEDRFRNMADNSPVMMWITDAQGLCTYLNTGWYEFTGQRAEDALGLGWLEAVHPDDAQRSEDIFLAANRDQVAFQLDYRLRRHDGTYRWCIDKAAPRFAADGSYLGYIGSVIDLTERREAEDALRAEQATLSAVLDALPVAVIIADAQGKIMRDNDANRTLWGVAPETNSWEQYMDWIGRWPKTGQRLRADEWAMTRSLVHGEHVRDELVQIERFGTGEKRLISNNASPVFDENGVIVAGVVAQVDVTDRHAAELALEQSEERLRQMANTIPQLAWYAEPDGQITWYNKRWYDYTGTTPEMMAGWGWQSVHDPEVLPSVLHHWKASIDSGEAFDMTFPLLGADGKYRPFLTRIEPLMDENGRVVQWFGTNTDVSEQQRVQQERERLLEAERAARAEAERIGQLKDEFLATLSHELRTPLNAILGWSQLLRHGSDLTDEVSEGLDVIARNAKTQGQLVDDLLDMSRIVSGKLRLDVQRLDLAEVVRAAVDSVEPAANVKGVRLEIVLDPHVGPVRGDASRLQQVVWNLLTNAVKFTPRGGKVQVALERVNSHVEVTISDTGVGIAPAFLPHVFDRFRQADSSTGREHGGLGLGLAIVKNLVEAHGGKVRAKSSGEGRGATFSIELPLMVIHGDEAEAVSQRRHPRLSSDNSIADEICDDHLLDGVRVLVVDDEPDARELVRRALTNCQARVSVAGSAAEGMDKLRHEEFDVLISDIGMAQTDGYAFMRQVRQLERDHNGDIPAVALTAFARSEDRRRALAAGYQMHIAKPVEPDELVVVVASLAGKLGR